MDHYIEHDDDSENEERKFTLEPNTVLKMPHISDFQFASPVLKINNSCNKWNRRMLVVNDDYIGYIRNVPKNKVITSKDVPKQC